MLPVQKLCLCCELSPWSGLKNISTISQLACFYHVFVVTVEKYVMKVLAENKQPQMNKKSNLKEQENCAQKLQALWKAEAGLQV